MCICIYIYTYIYVVDKYSKNFEIQLCLFTFVLKLVAFKTSGLNILKILF